MNGNNWKQMEIIGNDWKQMETIGKPLHKKPYTLVNRLCKESLVLIFW